MIYFNSEKQLFSTEFDDIYFSTSGAEAESEHVFISGNNLNRRFSECREFVIAEAGFGTGLNFLKTMSIWSKHYHPEKTLIYYGFEAYPLSPEILRKAHSNWADLSEHSEQMLENYSNTPQTSNRFHFKDLNIILELIIGDIRETITGLPCRVDAWFLDGFSPAKNPQMWSKELFRGMKATAKPAVTTFSTYSCARSVREGLTENGFTISKSYGFGKKRYMLKGIFNN